MAGLGPGARCPLDKSELPWGRVELPWVGSSCGCSVCSRGRLLLAQPVLKGFRGRRRESDLLCRVPGGWSLSRGCQGAKAWCAVAGVCCMCVRGHGVGQAA